MWSVARKRYRQIDEGTYEGRQFDHRTIDGFATRFSPRRLLSL